MDSEVMINFNKALLSVTESKAPISKQKIFDITKAAMNAIRYFKHVVLAIEKFLVKCRSEHKLSGLYVMDSILRQAKKQYKHKDVFAPRFAVNLRNTFTNILTCDTNDRLKAVRVINLWQANEIFKEEVIEPLLQYCRASGLEVDVKKVEMCVKGEKANMQIYGADISQTYETKQPKTPPSSFVPKTPPMELRPQTPNQMDETSERPTDNSLAERDVLSVLETLPEFHQLITVANVNRQLLKNVQKMLNERITEKLEIERRRQGNIKNLLSREFADDYSDEEEDEERTKNESSTQVFSKEHILSVAKSMLAEGVLSQELQQIHQQSTGQPRARTPPEAASHQQPFTFPPPNFSMPPPNGATFFTPIGVPPPAIQPGQMMHNFSTSRPAPQTASSSLSHESNGSDARGSSNRSRDQDRIGRKRERSRSRDHQHERGGDRDVRSRRDAEADSKSSRNDRSDRSRSDRRSGTVSGNIQTSSSSDRRRRTRSPESRSGGGSDRRSEHRGDRGAGPDKETRSRDSDNKEKERRKNGFPTHPKDDHVLIASRTLWFGKIPSNCSEADIRDAVKDAGQPEKINIVAPRGCAYVTMRERRAAFKIIDRLGKDLQILKKTVKISWATIPGIKENERLMDYWDSSRGIAQIPFSKLPDRLDGLLEGAFMDIYTLPTHLKDLYDARGPKGQQGLIPLPAMGGGPVPSADSAAIFSQGVLQQIQPPGLPLPANMFPFQQQLHVSSSSSTPQLMSNIGVGDQQQQPPMQLPSAAMLAAFGFPQGLMPPPPASNSLNAAFSPQFMAAAAAAAGGLLPNPFVGGPGAPPKALLPPPAANPPTPNFQQQNFRPPFGSNNRQPDFGGGGGMDSRGGRGGNFRGSGPPRGFNSQHSGGGFRGRGAGNFQRFDSPQSNNFNQTRGGGRGGGRGGHWNGPSDSFANAPGGFGGAGGHDFRNNESGFRGSRGGRFNSFPARGGPPSNNNFRGGRFNAGGDRPPSLFDAPPPRHHQQDHQQFGGGFPPRNAFNNSGSESTAPPSQQSPPGGPGLLPTPLFPPPTTRQFTRFSSINDKPEEHSNYAAPGTSPPVNFTQNAPIAAEDAQLASQSLPNNPREQQDRNQSYTSGGLETEEFAVSTTQQPEQLQGPRDLPSHPHNQGRNQSEVSRAEVEVSSTTFHDEHQQQQQLAGAHPDFPQPQQQQPQAKEQQAFEQVMEHQQENAAPTAHTAPETTEE